MASAVHHSSVLPCLPDLGTLTSINNCHEGGRVASDEALVAPPTPCSSADPASEGIDSVTLLSRPVKGFHHPRQHLFTDRLVGRFYVDSSLDAQTRKTSKCLAGRLGTAGSSNTTRPSTTAGGPVALQQFRSSHSPATTRRGKRMHASTSAGSLGSSNAGGVRQHSSGAMVMGLADRKEQIEKEIQEQKALIKKLEGRMASLSSRGGQKAGSSHVVDVPGGRGSTAPLQDETDVCRQDVDNRPATTPEPERAGQANSGGCLDNGHKCAVTGLSPAKRSVEHDRLRSHSKEAVSIQAVARGRNSRRRVNQLRAENIQREKSATCIQAAERGHMARRELYSTAAHPQHLTPQRARTYSSEKYSSAVKIQQNVRGAGKRKRFQLLQAAREDLERHLQAVVSLTSLLVQRATPDSKEFDNVNSTNKLKPKVQGVAAVAVRLLETSREDGLAKPPFDILQAMYNGMEQLRGALASLTTAVNNGHASDDKGQEMQSQCTTVAESCNAAEEALETIRKTLGADIQVGTPTLSVFAAASQAVPRDHPYLPAGSGRAAAVAVSGARGGLLVSPNSSSAKEAPKDMFSAENETRARGGGTNPAGRRELEFVPLRKLGVEDVGLLLHAHGFGEHASGFAAQAVDGVMLSDPNLCETDFAELGLGGEGAGSHNCRAQLVSFFRKCQEEGVVAPSGTAEHRREVTSAGDLGLHKPRDGKEETGRTYSGDTQGILKGVGPGEHVVCGTAGSPSVAELPWRRGSERLGRQDQDVIAKITIDPNEDHAEAAAAAGDVKRMSVKLNHGVVITVGGQGLEVVADADDLLESDTDNHGVGTREGEGKTLATRPRASPVKATGHRTSLGYPSLPLAVDSDVAGERDSSDTGNVRLPPGVAVTTADVTVNVFR